MRLKKNAGKETNSGRMFSTETKLKAICHCNACSKQQVCIYKNQIEQMCKKLEDVYKVVDIPEGTIIPYIGCYYYEDEFCK